MMQTGMHRRTHALVVLAALAALSMPARAGIVFTEVWTEAGLPPEVFGGSTFHSLGITWVDADGDDFPDLFLLNGFGRTTHLWHNNGDGTFQLADELLPALPNQEYSESRFADYDNDGDNDIYVWVTNEQFDLHRDNEPDGPPNILLHNKWVENGGQVISGQPLFENRAVAAGVDNLAPVPFGDYPGHRSRTGGWLDYDRDGCLDLFVASMHLQAKGELSNSNFLYRNRCDGTFEDVSAASGIQVPGDTDGLRPTLTFLGAHLNDDLWPDIYAANVHEAAPHSWDRVFFNNGDGTFTDVVPQRKRFGIDAGSAMGIDVGDFDLNGQWDLYITDVFVTGNDSLPLGNVLYLGNGGGNYTINLAPARGVAAGFSWGTNIFDADLDGDEDLFVGGTEEMFLFENDGAANFVNVRNAAGLAGLTQSRGTGAADYDRDGDIDFAMIVQGGRPRLFRNDTETSSHWAEFKLVGTDSNRSGINAVVKLEAGGKSQMRQVLGSSSAHSQDDLVVHFGLGAATTVDRLEVQWPSGRVDVLNGLSVDMLHTVTEGENLGIAVSLSPVGDPIVVPPGGGPVPFELSLTNNTSVVQTLNLVSNVDMPNGNHLRVLGPLTLSLNPGQSKTQSLSQEIPGEAVPGEYTYNAVIGIMPELILWEDSFDFTKE